MPMELFDYQKDAVSRMHNGCILWGGVGSGKSVTAIAYYFFKNGGAIGKNTYVKMPGTPPDLYIITTAKKRDTFEWDDDLIKFCLTTNQEKSIYPSKVVVDSWNNIAKYKGTQGAFFIFDEQRVVGKGEWVKSFWNIAARNEWVLLSATPGDKWEDYIPVFVANGFYRNRTDFNRQHIVFCRSTTFPKVDRYLNEGRLVRLRNKVLVPMRFTNDVERKHIPVYTDYDTILYKSTFRNRWNPYTNAPIQNISEFCQTIRRIVNSDPSRIEAVAEIVKEAKRAIIFYCYNFELDILRSYNFGDDVEVAEWNGHKHQPIPDSEKWVYLVNYTAGSEGWNCTLTDTIIFYSQHYSYRMMVQAAGRIDRLNTPYSVLYYYHLKSHSSIDLAISKALSKKKKFNESSFTTW